jgi:hypothetical protein
MTSTTPAKTQSILFTQKIRNYMKASYPLLWVKTHEEGRVTKEILHALAETTGNVNVYSWDSGNSLRKHGKSAKGEDIWVKVSGDTGLMQLINYIRAWDPEKTGKNLVILKDFHFYLNTPQQIRDIRNAIDDLKRGTMIIITAPVIKIPTELEKDIQILDFALPDEAQLRDILTSVHAAVMAKYEANPEKGPQLSEEIAQSAVEAAKGLTSSEVHDAYALAIVENKSYNNGFVISVFDEKVKQVKRHGLLEYIKPDENFDSIGGLDTIKNWISVRAKAYSPEARTFRLPYPKGILLCGCTGTGKTLLAKAIANKFGFPLFKLDVGALFGRLVGESEENFRKVTSTLDSLGRCVVLID